VKFPKIANITVSFSWVFMIIVGVFFIVLAYNIIDEYKENEDLKFQIELKNTLRNIFNNFGRTAGTEESSIAPIGNIFRDSEVEILCEGGFSILSINGEYDVNNDFLKNYPTFMTKINKKSIDMTYVAVENFRMPFKITNVLAIVSKKNMIIFDTNTQIGIDLEKKFRRGAYGSLTFEGRDLSNVESVILENIKDDIDEKNLDSIVFVTDTSENIYIDELNLDEIKIDAQIIRIETEINNRGGIINFYGKNNLHTQYPFYDMDESLTLQTMAVFSSAQAFNCSYQMLDNSISNVYDFYINKSEYFLKQDSPICTTSMIGATTFSKQKVYYSNMVDNLKDIENHINTNFFNDIGELNNIIKELELNHLYVEDSNCPLIY
jgi:hypothetical protein